MNRPMRTLHINDESQHELLTVGDDDIADASARSCTSVSKDDCRYPMNHPRRGVAAIFNHERLGSEHDCASLGKSLVRLGFEVETYRDLTLAGIEDRLMELSKRDHSDCDCFLLTFMSHGVEGKLRAKDRIFDINLLWDYFTAERCPSLTNKPKIFIIQACQGHERQGSVLVSSPTATGLHTLDDQEHVRLLPCYSLPLCADFLLALSTIPGFVSWRSPAFGSWYIQTLCSQLDKHGFSTDLQSLLTRVSHVVALDYTYHEPLTETANKQLPSFISMLIRELRFTRKPDRFKPNKCRKRSHSTLEEAGSDEEEECGSKSLMKRLGGITKKRRRSCKRLSSISPWRKNRK